MNQKRKSFEQRRSRRRAISEREERESYLIKKGILLVLTQLSVNKGKENKGREN